MMTLTDIKSKIVEHLSTLTIDDFYVDADLQSVKPIFSELINLKPEQDVLDYLKERFPETRSDTLRISLEEAITSYNNEISLLKNEILSVQNNLSSLNEQTTDIKKKQEEIPYKNKKISDKIAEIDAEIKQIEPLAGKAPYNKQLESLVRTRAKKNTELESYPAIISKIKAELEAISLKIKSEKDVIAQKKHKIESFSALIDNKQDELKELAKKEETQFKDEYNSLEFLFLVLLQKKISVSENYKNRSPNLNINNCDFDQIRTFISPYFSSENVIPENWRSILQAMLSKPIPKISGTFTDINYNNKHFFIREELELTHIDTSFLLATKIAVASKPSLQIEGNKIFLGLSGGMAAMISFRKKGTLISKFQQNPFEFFAKCVRDYRYKEPKQYVSQTLYQQTGYADSSVEISTPVGYYMLSKDYVIEIDYLPAPILFDTNTVSHFSPNISGKAKKEAEEEEHRQQEEDEY
ncbi:MAG TPA: hypothetical protein VK168_16575 [Saprospiraceae bacterium]|nr:hypothetical protein [Saprospiraceae bacterium]